MTDQDRARWTKLVADYEASELTQREFATERGISFSNLPRLQAARARAVQAARRARARRLPRALHLRRRFFDAQSAAPDAAKRAMDFILDVYRVERAALDADLLGTPEHLAMRQTQSKAVMDKFRAWLLAEQRRHPPRGPMGEAIGYALGQWDALTLFLTDPHLPIDNNASERGNRPAGDVETVSRVAGDRR